MWKQRIIQVLWIMAGAGTLVLLVAAMQKKSTRGCNDVQIEISGAMEHVFVDEKDVTQMLQSAGTVTGVSMAGIDLRRVEERLEQDPWILNAELFFDNKQVLQVRITEREPLARVFTVIGNSFYLDSSGKVLPLSDKLSARVPVFTSFPYSGKPMKEDSALLRSVLELGKYISADSFWNAQIAQVDIVGDQFEMVPVIGNHVIRFGTATDIDKKFKKLFSFYRNVSAKLGFDKYESIQLMYEGQVVATRRGAAVPAVDSADALRQLQQSLETVQVMAKDTVVAKPATAKPVVEKKEQGQVAPPKPKAVMKQ